MKKILVITNQCFVQTSANGICLENVIKKLKEKDIYCDIIAFADRNEEKKIDDYIMLYLLDDDQNKKSYTSRMIRRIKYKICYEFICPDIYYLFRRKYYQKAVDLIRKNKYQAVLASSGGFFSQIIAEKISKKMNIPMISMFLDPPASINFLYKKKRPYYKKMLEYEKQAFEISKYVLLEKNLYKEMVKYYPGDTIKKIGMPLVVERGAVEQQSEENSIVFVGTLWKDIRNPGYVLQLFEEVKDFKLKFYGNEQTRLVLKQYDNGEKLYEGCLQHEEVDAVIKKATYLLNISNTNIVQTPSKLYEYMSYGKPIINIVKNKDDITIKLMEKYGNAISLVEGEKNNLHRLKGFLSKKHDVMDYAEIKEKFYDDTPECTAYLISDLLSSI